MYPTGSGTFGESVRCLIDPGFGPGNFYIGAGGDIPTWFPCYNQVQFEIYECDEDFSNEYYVTDMSNNFNYKTQSGSGKLIVYINFSSDYGCFSGNIPEFGSNFLDSNNSVVFSKVSINENVSFEGVDVANRKHLFEIGLFKDCIGRRYYGMSSMLLFDAILSDNQKYRTLRV